MKETGILMTTVNVQAILEGRKSQTRRTRGLDKINENPDDWNYIATDGLFHVWEHKYDFLKSVTIKCPYGQVGDWLYIRETFSYVPAGEDEPVDFGVFYYADGEQLWWRDNADTMNYPIIPRKRPSIHMPKKFARIWRELTANPVPERVQDISEADAMAEGVEGYSADGGQTFEYRGNFAELWDSINLKRGHGWNWNRNEWVWPIHFKLIKEVG